MNDSLVWYAAAKNMLLGIWAAGSLAVTIWLQRRLTAVWDYRRRHPALYRSASQSSRLQRLLLAKPVRHLREELDLAGLSLGAETVITGMLLLGLVGLFGSDALLQTTSRHIALGDAGLSEVHVWPLSAVVSLIAGSIPYILIRFRVQRKRQRIALRMIMVVQNIIGHYRPRLTLAEVIAGCSPTMPDEVRGEWRRLELALHMKSIDEALYEFAERVDNEWAHDLTDLLLIGVHYGTDMTESLHHLVGKMQTSKRHEENRLAMITVYRIGTTFMVFFAFFIIGFNVYADPHNYRHYFVDPVGKTLLLLSFAVMFVSMLLVIRSGRRAF
ncbi:hypothetical protein P9314_26365 [Paenibacillus validus]|uniref:type II secretion system F family protein n=1 Tax=Paenibacillus TaxID=44249 RepID=UPI000FD8D9CA|nr:MULTISPECIES: hypothetical protein [Paenibacillus]MED4604156.1 hypothetical protein [Paenibacillus validus]MED4609606.1 hypothetical protein [Paenibacillus validus]